MATPEQVAQQLKKLPKSLRKRALATFNAVDNAAWKRTDMRLRKTESIAEAINAAFRWRDTREGYEFWKAVRQHYELGSPMPSLRNLPPV